MDDIVYRKKTKGDCKMNANYRIKKVNGTLLNAGTDMPSWFTLEMARNTVNRSKGQIIIIHNGEREVAEAF